MNTIGFETFEKPWEGPVYLQLDRTTEHTKTVRYRCRLRTRNFDLYAPLFMIRGLTSGQVPERLIIALGKAPASLRKIGFRGSPEAVRMDSDVCEFAFASAKVNSIRYDLVHTGDVYALYVPKEIFSGEPHPKLVYLRMGVPGRKTSSA